jgi:hypothetical protein
MSVILARITADVPKIAVEKSAKRTERPLRDAGPAVFFLRCPLKDSRFYFHERQQQYFSCCIGQAGLTSEPGNQSALEVQKLRKSTHVVILAVTVNDLTRFLLVEHRFTVTRDEIRHRKGKSNAPKGTNSLWEEQKAQIKSEILTSTFGEDVVKVAMVPSVHLYFFCL